MQNWTAIDKYTGKVFNKQKMDRETIEHFTLAVQVEDSYSQTGPQVDTGNVLKRMYVCNLLVTC